MRGEIWLGDAARAFAAIEPSSSDDLRRVASMLGFAVLDRGRVISRSVQTGPVAFPATPVAELDEHETGNDHETGGSLGERKRHGSSDVPRLTPVATQAVSPTGWGNVRSLSRVTSEHLSSVLEHQPLLPPQSTPAILYAVLAEDTHAGPLDVERVVVELAQRRVVDPLPHRRHLALPFSVQILVDLGVSMQPFRRDQNSIITQIRGIAGGERTKVMYFADSPLRSSGPGPPLTWRPYEAPCPGTRVLLLSDVGIGGPALHPRRSQPDEWQSLARMLQRHGCSIVALVPYPPHRWPATITRLFPLVMWDRNTTTATASVALQRRSLR